MKNESKELLINLLLNQSAGAGKSIVSSIELATKIYCHFHDESLTEIMPLLEAIQYKVWVELWHELDAEYLDKWKKCQQVYSELLDNCL